MKTLLSENLDLASAKEQYNEYCKRILCNRQILAIILKETVFELKFCSVEDISEKYILDQPEISEIPVFGGRRRENILGESETDEVPEEGRVTFDIRFRVKTPQYEKQIVLYVNLEAQKSFSPGYSLIKRGILYCARMISSQYGIEFTGKNYDEIKKVYSIWICMNVPKKYANTVVSYSIAPNVLFGDNEKTAAQLRSQREEYDLLCVVQIRLGESCNTESEMLGMLDTLFSKNMSTQHKKAVLEQKYHLKMEEEIGEELIQMCNLADLVEQRGVEKGKTEGESSILALNNYLLSQNRIDDLKRASEDKKYREQLINEILLDKK